MSTRVRFQEKPCFYGQYLVEPLALQDGTIWSPVLSCPAQFPLAFFETALMTLINHPEYNSSLILRSEIVSDHNVIHEAVDISPWMPSLRGYMASRNIHRRLLPRRPERDGSLEQDCTFYLSHDGISPHPCVLILTPRLAEQEALPYYHPSVAHLAFRYATTCSPNSPECPHILVEIVPLNTIQIDLSSRIYRTCLALLETLDRYGWGAANSYQKRVLHDVLVPRDAYQDLYLILKERHKSLADNWHESTDPSKHVFEDVGIATFLMLLWKNTYCCQESPQCRALDLRDIRAQRPWDDWPRPPGGFVDIGCGNGILTHILLSEGYIGEGFDLRARTSWSHYPQETQRHLHVQPFNPFESHPLLRPSTFVIGNHADELTPWIPVVSALLPASGYLSIPCCPWDFDGRYERGRTGAYHVPHFEPKSGEHEAFVSGLGIGTEGQAGTSYSKYRIWLAYLSRACGWKVECEMLRIPSTRNWAIVGRQRIDQEAGHEVSQSIISAVRERDIFKVRTPEGKMRGGLVPSRGQG
ncbi:DUF1613-domain-containing protein [Gautieria morchelliformis]|nr:DUF1613-domain-containing protein [Gautieria morchelliformis]